MDNLDHYVSKPGTKGHHHHGHHANWLGIKRAKTIWNYWENKKIKTEFENLKIIIIIANGHHANWLGIKRAESIEAIYSGKREQLCSYVIPLTLVIAHSLFIHEDISQNFDT